MVSAASSCLASKFARTFVAARCVVPLLIPPRIINIVCARFKGHSHWQNVKSSKEAGDKKKAKLNAWFCNRVKVLVREHGPDPSINSQLHRLLVDGSNNNVPKDVLQRAIQQAISKPVQSFCIDYKGPGGSLFILMCLSDMNRYNLQYILNGRLYKVPGGFDSKDKTVSVRSYFEHVGVVTVLKDSTPPEQPETSKRSWNAPPPVNFPPPLSFEDAETLAIELNAMSVNETIDAEGRPAYEVLCEPDHVKRIEKYLTGKHYALAGCGQEFRPYSRVTLSAQHMQYVDQFYDALDDMEEIENIFDNIAHPGEEQ